MKVAKLDLPVMASWMERNGRRLDSSPYLSGAMEARALLDKLRLRKEPLHQLTAGYNGGIYNGPQFVRNYVDDPAHGVPFLTSSSMLWADLSTVSLLRRKDAESSKLSYLRLKEGMTLISCSGTIGRMVYTRPDMDGMWSSQDVLKVVPDPDKILSGYLYAYLSSRFGVPLVVSGTYGAIIQHIEPHHIANLPVPQAPDSLQRQVHDLVTLSGEMRAESKKMLEKAQSILISIIGLPLPTHRNKFLGYHVLNSNILASGRLDSFFHNPIAQSIEHLIEKYKDGYIRLEDMTEDIFDVPPFKHIYVHSGYGVPFFTSGDMFLIDRKADKYLSKTQTKGLEKYIILKGWILLARSGQLGGIVGRLQYADSALDKAATSDHIIRIVPKPGVSTAGFLYTFLASPKIGYPLITRAMCGSSIPALWPKDIREIKVPVVKADVQEELEDIVSRAFELRVEATSYEDRARQLVEEFIEGTA